MPSRHDAGIMNDTSNPNSSQSHAENQPGGTENAGSQSGRRVLESLRSAVNEGAQQAKAAAEKAIPKVKAAVSGAAYWLGFGASFASVFSYTVAKELAPEILKAGLRDGAQAGQKKGEQWVSKLKEHHTGATPSDEATQSGVA